MSLKERAEKFLKEYDEKKRQSNHVGGMTRDAWERQMEMAKAASLIRALLAERQKGDR